MDSVNKDIPITHVEPMQLLDDRAHVESRFASLLATLLCVIALVLATSGIYGVLSYSVAQRTTEVGIRMAIGTPRAQVLRMILADGFAWILPGPLAGLLLRFPVTPLLTHLFYSVQPTDLANYAMMLIGVLVVSALAAFLPARRRPKEAGRATIRLAPSFGINREQKAIRVAGAESTIDIQKQFRTTPIPPETASFNGLGETERQCPS